MLLAARNLAPLTQVEITRAVNTFLGMDSSVNVRYDAEEASAFHVVNDEENQYGEIVFGPDIYPGPAVADPNAALSLTAAVAHELSHYYRWRDALQLNPPELAHIDEAITSLQALLRYEQHLQPHDIRQLVGDAIQRLQLYVSSVAGE